MSRTFCWINYEKKTKTIAIEGKNGIKMDLKTQRKETFIHCALPSFNSKLSEYQTFAETLASLIELKPANKSIKCTRYPRVQQDEARLCSKAFNTDVHRHDY